MKIAICISGQPRFFEAGFDSLSNTFLHKYKCDIFIQTYESDEGHEFIKLAQPKRYRLDDPHRIDFQISKYALTNKAPETNILNMFLMYRNIKNCMSLIDEEYDLVVRTRSDLLYDGTLDLSKIEATAIYIPQGGDARGGIFDIFALSGMQGMHYYATLFNELNRYLERGVFAHPETLLRHHLLFNQDLFNIVRFPWGIKIVREIKDSTIYSIDALPKNVFSSF